MNKIAFVSIAVFFALLLNQSILALDGSKLPVIPSAPQEIEKKNESLGNISLLLGQASDEVRKAFGNPSMITENIMDNTVYWYKSFEVHFDSLDKVMMVSLNGKYKKEIFEGVKMKKTGVQDLWNILSFQQKEDVQGIHRTRKEVTLEDKKWIYYDDLGLVFTFNSKDELEVVEINENFTMGKLEEQLVQQKQ